MYVLVRVPADLCGLPLLLLTLVLVVDVEFVATDFSDVFIVLGRIETAANID